MSVPTKLPIRCSILASAFNLVSLDAHGAPSIARSMCFFMRPNITCAWKVARIIQWVFAFTTNTEHYINVSYSLHLQFKNNSKKSNRYIPMKGNYMGILGKYLMYFQSKGSLNTFLFCEYSVSNLISSLKWPIFNLNQTWRSRIATLAKVIISHFCKLSKLKTFRKWLFKFESL